MRIVPSPDADTTLSGGERRLLSAPPSRRHARQRRAAAGERRRAGGAPAGAEGVHPLEGPLAGVRCGTDGRAGPGRWRERRRSDGGSFFLW